MDLVGDEARSMKSSMTSSMSSSMKRVRFDEQAAGRFQGSVAGASGSLAGASGSPQRGRHVAHCSLVVFFLAVAHAAATSGSFTHASDRGAVARGASAVGRASQRSEVDVRDAVIFAAGAVGALAMSLGAAAAELQVPSKQYPTIQSAIDAAADGDVVVIAAGTFTESCIVQGKAIEIRGAGADQTTWVAPVGARCLAVPDSSGSALGLFDVRFTGGTLVQNGCAVDLEGHGAKTVERCRFEGCGGLAALEVFGSGTALRHCAFIDNATGLSVAHGENMTVEDCVFDSNSQSSSSGGGGSIWVPSDIDFYACSFVARRTNFRTGYSQNGAPVRVVASGLFESCRFESGVGGVANAVQSYYGSSVARFSNTVFCGAAAPLFGGSGQFIDDGGNQSLASCTPPCPADFVDDGTVNAADLGVLLNFWGTDGSGFPGVDLDGDGIVGAADLSTLLSNWGECPE
jgi:hypothetical protein